MPAIVAHHIFGEEALGLLPEGVVEGEEERLAFLLGSQGPDPLFARFRALPTTSVACHRLAGAIQGEKPTEGFAALRDALASLPSADERLGCAFVLGVLAHYALDSAAHPFVIAQQRALVAADAELEHAEHEVHGVIESDLDVWMLWEKRGKTVEEQPVTEFLARTERVERAAGALMSQLAYAVFDVDLGADEYPAAVADYEFVYRLIDPADAALPQRLASIEGLARGRSMAEAMAHRVVRDAECPAANLDRREWENPFTGDTSTDSFEDLYEAALAAYPALAAAFLDGDLELSLNYEGCPVEG